MLGAHVCAEKVDQYCKALSVGMFAAQKTLVLAFFCYNAVNLAGPYTYPLSQLNFSRRR